MAEAKKYGSLSIIKVEGIGEKYKKLLNEAGVKTTAKLLEVAGTKKGRKDLAEKTKISETLILEWVNLSDLIRISGIGEEYSDLLEEAGVDTVIELAKRVPQNLYDKMLEVNTKKKLVRRVPPLSMVKKWVEQAKKLPRAVEY